MKEWWGEDVNIFAPKNVAPEWEVKEAKSAVRSCIMTYKNGMRIDSLREEYKRVTGEEIDYFKLGYNSLFHFLRDIPEIRKSRNEDGEPVLIVKASEKTQHLMDLIKSQKEPKLLMRSRESHRDKRRNSIRQKQRRDKRNQQDEQRVLDSKTSANSSSSSSCFVPVDENSATPTICNNYDFENEISVCTNPTVGTTQLLGDDYFLQLCIKYLSDPLQRRDPKSAISCGTVQSGLTIKKATKRLDKIRIMSNKLAINVGTVDIYNRRTHKEMIADYKELLEKLKNKYGYSKKQIVVCTLPPLANVAMFCENKKYATHVAFNGWLRDYAAKENYVLLDLHREFTNENMIIEYDLFQNNARMVSGTIHPHVLLNYFGRQKCMKLLASV